MVKRILHIGYSHMTGIKKDQTEQREQEQPVCSRRALLKGAVGSGLLAATGALALSAEAGAAVANKDKAARWDETLDIVVVGSGFAGLAAAAEAADRGMKVVVLEKMPRFGGNSVISHGVEMTIANSFTMRLCSFLKISNKKSVSRGSIWFSRVQIQPVGRKRSAKYAVGKSLPPGSIFSV